MLIPNAVELTIQIRFSELSTLSAAPLKFTELLDPTNPLAWILAIALLLGTLDKVINAVVKLIGAIAGKRERDRA